MKLAVIGGRDFVDYDHLKRVMQKIRTPIDLIVSGGAKGADSLAERYAQEFGIETKIFPADWDTYGKRAGFMRNQDIVNTADSILAFWDGQSKGTRSSIELAEKQGKTIHIEGYTPAPKINPHYQRVRVDGNGLRFLQCHSRGAKEYSPFFCSVEAFGETRSIEDHYQSTKVFRMPQGHFIKASDWREAKALQDYKPLHGEDLILPQRVGFELPNGLKLGNSNVVVEDLVIQWYIALWHKYLRRNTHLIDAAQGYDGFEDIFEGAFPFSQAKVIEKCVKDGIHSLYPMYSGLREALATHQLQ